MAEDLKNVVLEQFCRIVGSAGLVTDAEEIAPSLIEWRGLYQGRAPAIVAPADTAQAAAILRICPARPYPNPFHPGISLSKVVPGRPS